ncbi:DUF2254 domain-containing protein [Methyloligella sp. 2.7D]|uniref:DUF2254 domain-containing protein n=1 Tax=unclassified Methyloligella TaxID=2625955 RepID=UPI00157C9999|nr:DUF2254 domain-containing protein [Methyloligella sp. GL2]QKP77266.1 DUF2254 domain-containing protein [Methyloligella sp. GL2]
MLNRLYAFWLNIRSSLWALPLAMTLVAVVAALALVRVDLEVGDTPPWYLYSGTPDGASQFLSDLVTAIITMATLAISITMVVLTLAAQQLGPRLIRSFMADWRTQASLGLMIASVVYLILVLRSIYAADNGVPNIAVTAGTALILINILALLIFVHHLARSIIADTVIAQVGGMLDEEIERLLPYEKDDEPNGEMPDFPEKDAAPLPASASGYIQGIEHESLVKIAAKNDAVILLEAIAGDHRIEAASFGKITPASCAQDDVIEEIQACIQQSSGQYPVQDLRYYIHQLVEIALRALSPSITDPFTAMAAIDRLASAMQKVMRRGRPQTAWCDEDGTVRLIAPRYGFAALADTAFFQIRHHAEGSPSVQIRLIEALAQLAEHAHPEQREVLQDQAQATVNAMEDRLEDEDKLRWAKEKLAAIKKSG